MKFRQASLIYNPASGRKRTSRQKKVEQAREILLPWIDQVDLTPTSRRGDATRLASEAVVAGCDLVIACGGDGTINEVAGGLAGSDIPLFPLPAGTANVLAEETGLPMDPRGAAAEFPSLAAERVPLGVVHYSNPRPGSRHFLLMCGAGVDASIVYHLDTRLKDYMGQGAYWVGSIEQLQRKFESFEIRMNGKTHLSTFAVISKSRRYAGKLTLTPNAHLLAEHFEVVVFHGDSPLRYIGYIAQIATQTLDHFPDVSFHFAEQVEILTPADQRVYLEVDGEYAGRLPAKVEIAPESLMLLLPPDYARRASQEAGLLPRRARRRAAPDSYPSPHFSPPDDRST